MVNLDKNLKAIAFGMALGNNLLVAFVLLIASLGYTPVITFPFNEQVLELGLSIISIILIAKVGYDEV